MRTKLLTLVALALTVALLSYPARFALAFEIFGKPVHSPSAGWLGPTPRNAGTCIIDAGKVNSWNCQDTSVFSRYALGCKLWLKVFGYSGT
jgi:hypothetical protein